MRPYTRIERNPIAFRESKEEPPCPFRQGGAMPDQGLGRAVRVYSTLRMVMTGVMRY
jgi:hypothetical protein